MGRLEARSAARRAVAGVVVFALIAAGAYLAATARSGLPGSTTTTVRAAFTNVDALQVGADVRQDSVRIGRVSDLQFADGVAVVTMELDGEKSIYADARAAVWDFSALGAKFVELFPGTPAAGPLGDQIVSAERTVESADIYQLFNVFDEPTRAAATGAVRELGGGAAGLSGALHDYLRAAPDLLTDVETVSEVLSSDQADLPGLLRSAERLSSRFVGREQQIAALVEQTDVTLRAVSADEGLPLSDTLDRLPATLDHARTALDALDVPLADAKTAVTDLRPGAEALAASEEDLRGVLRESVPPLKQVPGVAEQAEPAVADLTRTFADARPLAPKVTRALDNLVTPLQVLAPYAPEIATLFVRWESLVAEDINGLHYARIGAAPGVRTGGGPVLPDSVDQGYNPYPEPGNADNDRAELTPGGVR
ncbi:MAG: MCE family protein [Pseudonocardiaceae bacterium]|nr:MCE family protein [Pseudonocardiaceae bacterium]